MAPNVPTFQIKGEVMAAQPSETSISERFIASALHRLREGKPLRREISSGGRVHVDRQLPFLVVHRRPPGKDDADVHLFVLAEAAYLLAPGSRKHHAEVSSLVQGIASTMSEVFGSFLIIEIWPMDSAPNADPVRPPAFRIHRTTGDSIDSTVDALDQALARVRVKGQMAKVDVVSRKTATRSEMRPLLAAEELESLNGHVLGIALDPVYESTEGERYPLVRRALRRGFSRAIKRAVFEFTRRKTSHRPPHYQALGRRSMVKAVWEVDRMLAEVSNTFDFLLQVTPVNTNEAWTDFRRRRFESNPEFASRPLRLDPALCKRQLFQIPIERIEDPTLSQLFRDQQVDIDRKLTMLGDRGTKQFLYGSLQVFGGVDAPLLNAAQEILFRVPSRTRDESNRGAANASDFAARAEREFAHYRKLCPDMKSQVQIRDDVVGMMVSRGNLLVGSQTKIPQSRVEALLAHEVGTHVLTYMNGRSQPFRQLYVGLPGYEDLQEGLAVLSEYLVGGLSRPRLRLLAARVVAADRMIQGATFIDVFRELDRAHDFAQRTAFNITMRVFRSGGLTKDVAYLRGLNDLLGYLREGGDFDKLLLGKFSLYHVPIVEELQWRKVLGAPPLRPRYLDEPAVKMRLDALRRRVSVLDLVERGKR